GFRPGARQEAGMGASRPAVAEGVASAERGASEVPVVSSDAGERWAGSWAPGESAMALSAAIASSETGRAIKGERERPPSGFFLATAQEVAKPADASIGRRTAWSRRMSRTEGT